MFTDDTVELDGPVLPGPALHEWADLDGRAFAGRQLQGAYLRWVYERSVAALPPGVTVRHHPCRALRVSGPREGRQQVWLDGRARPSSPTPSSSPRATSMPNSTRNSGS